jgi:4-nitrophenyl phosphatase
VTLNLDEFDAILLDLDGTVYHEEHSLPGAVDLIQRLQIQKRRFACLTNSTSSPSRLAQRLDRMGVTLAIESIFTACAAAVEYILGRWTTPRVFSLATEGAHEMLDGKVVWVERADQPCDVVMVGVPTSVYATEPRQRIALQLLREQRQTVLLGMCADRVYPSPRGLEFGSGALTLMMAYAADATPVYTGKPEPIFFQELCRRLNVEPRRCVLIGDNLESDIGGARRLGMTAWLTLTGITRREDLANLVPGRQPDGVIDDLRSLL